MAIRSTIVITGSGSDTGVISSLAYHMPQLKRPAKMKCKGMLGTNMVSLDDNIGNQLGCTLWY